MISMEGYETNSPLRKMSSIMLDVYLAHTIGIVIGAAEVYGRFLRATDTPLEVKRIKECYLVCRGCNKRANFILANTDGEETMQLCIWSSLGDKILDMARRKIEEKRRRRGGCQNAYSERTTLFENAVDISRVWNTKPKRRKK